MYTTTDLTYQTNRILELDPYVGQTPLFEIKRIFNKPGVRLFAKLEWHQFGGSVKARAAYRIIREALLSGELNGSNQLLDATSGNTGIAYAIFCAVAGIRITLCVPANASRERKQFFDTLGVNVIYTDAMETTDGAQRVAREMKEAEPEKYYYADQYSNVNNWKAHYHSTAEELWHQTRGGITHFVTGLGTTGTFTGTGRRLKELKDTIQLIALQPETALHGMEGWKHLETAHVPPIFDNSLADKTHLVDTLEAYEVIKQAAKYEGLMLSPSSAANLYGAIQVANELEEGIVVTVLPDDSSKYGEVINQLFNN